MARPSNEALKNKSLNQLQDYAKNSSKKEAIRVATLVGGTAVKIGAEAIGRTKDTSGTYTGSFSFTPN